MGKKRKGRREEKEKESSSSKYKLVFNSMDILESRFTTVYTNIYSIVSKQRRVTPVHIFPASKLTKQKMPNKYFVYYILVMIYHFKSSSVLKYP